MRAESLDQGAEVGSGRRENVANRGTLTSARLKLRSAIDNNGLTGLLPNGEVDGGIAGVIEGALSKAFGETSAFVLTSKVSLAVAGENFMEQAQVISDTPGKAGIRGSREDKLATHATLSLEIFQERLIVREGRGVNVDTSCDLVLQAGATGEQPDRNEECIKRIMPEQPNQRFPDHICINEGAIKVDTKRHGWVFNGNRRRHVQISFWKLADRIGH